jgi:predicted nucleic acid-binding protein
VKEYVLDANAVLRYFGVSEGQGTNRVRALFEQAERGQARLSMSVINLGEVLYVLLRHVGESRARHYVQVLQHVVTMVDADAAQALGAAEIKHNYKLGYADSFAAMLAVTLKATLVSADPGFEELGKTLKWIRLPGFGS